MANKADWYINFLEGRTGDMGEVARSGLDFEIAPHDSYLENENIKALEEDFIRRNGLYEGDDEPPEEMRKSVFDTALKSYNVYNELEQSLPGGLENIHTKDDPYLRALGVGPVSTRAALEPDTDNPLMLGKGFSPGGPEREWSVNEIIQGRPFRWDTEKKEWVKGSLEDMGFFGTLSDPQAYAAHGADVKDADGNVISKKGEYKIDPVSGTFYAESATGDTSGKRVVSSFDVLSREEGFWNNLDVFDNDGIEGNFAKALIRHGIHYGAYFVPVAGQALLYGELAAGFTNIGIEASKQLYGGITGEEGDFGMLDRFQTGVQQLRFGHAEDAGEFSLTGIVEMAGQALMQLKQLRGIAELPNRIRAFKNAKTLKELKKADPARYNQMMVAGSRMGMAYMAGVQAKDVADWAEQHGVTDPRHRALIFAGVAGTSAALYFASPFERWFEKSLGIEADAIRFGNITKQMGIDDLVQTELKMLSNKSLSGSIRDRIALRIGQRWGKRFADASKAANKEAEKTPAGLGRAFGTAKDFAKGLGRKADMAAKGLTLGAGAFSEAVEEMSEVALQYGIGSLYNGIVREPGKKDILPGIGSGEFWQDLGMSAFGGAIGGLVFKAAELPSVKSYEFGQIVEEDLVPEFFSYLDKVHQGPKGLASKTLSMARDAEGKFLPVQKTGSPGLPEHISQNDFMYAMIKNSFAKEELLYRQYNANVGHYNKVFEKLNMDFGDIYGVHSHFSIRDDARRQIAAIKDIHEKKAGLVEELKKTGDPARKKQIEQSLEEGNADLLAAEAELREITSGLRAHRYILEAGALLRPERAKVYGVRNMKDFTGENAEKDFREYVASGQRGRDLRKGMRALGEWSKKTGIDSLAQRLTYKPGAPDKEKKEKAEEAMAYTYLTARHLREKELFGIKAPTVADLKKKVAAYEALPAERQIRDPEVEGARAVLKEIGEMGKEGSGTGFFISYQRVKAIADAGTLTKRYNFLAKQLLEIMVPSTTVEGESVPVTLERKGKAFGARDMLTLAPHVFSDPELHGLFTKHTGLDPAGHADLTRVDNSGRTGLELILPESGGLAALEEMFNSFSAKGQLPEGASLSAFARGVAGFVRELWDVGVRADNVADEGLLAKLQLQVDGIIENIASQIEAYAERVAPVIEVQNGIMGRLDGLTFPERAMGNGLFRTAVLEKTETRQKDAEGNETVVKVDPLYDDFLLREYFELAEKGAGYLDETGEKAVAIGDMLEELYKKEAWLYGLFDQKVANGYMDARNIGAERYGELASFGEGDDGRQLHTGLLSSIIRYRGQLEELFSILEDNKRNLTENLKKSDLKYLKSVVEMLGKGVPGKLEDQLNGLAVLVENGETGPGARKTAYSLFFKAAEEFSKNFDPQAFEPFRSFNQPMDRLYPRYEEGPDGLFNENEAFKLAIWNMFYRLGRKDGADGPEVNHITNIYRALREHMLENDAHYAPFAAQEIMGILQIATKLFNPYSFAQEDPEMVSAMREKSFVDIDSSSIFLDGPGGAGKSKVMGKAAANIYSLLKRAAVGEGAKIAVFASDTSQVGVANESFDSLGDAVIKHGSQTFKDLMDFVFEDPSSFEEIYEKEVSSSENIANTSYKQRILKKELPLSKNVKAENLSKTDIIVVDEATNLTATQIWHLSRAIGEWNARGNRPVRLVYMGDSYQRGRVYYDGKSTVSDNFEFLNIERTVRVNMSLRAGESNLITAIRGFERLLTKEVTGVKGTKDIVTGAGAIATASQTDPLVLGHEQQADGTWRGIADLGSATAVMKALTATLGARKEGETVALIVPEEKYSEYVKQLPGQEVQVLTLAQVQSREFDHVFSIAPPVTRDVVDGGEMTARMKDIYTLLTRARKSFVHNGLGFEKLKFASLEGSPGNLNVRTVMERSYQRLTLDSGTLQGFKDEKVASLSGLGEIGPGSMRTGGTGTGDGQLGLNPLEAMEYVKKSSVDKYFEDLMEPGKVMTDGDVPMKQSTFYISQVSLNNIKKMLSMPGGDTATREAVLLKALFIKLRGGRNVRPNAEEAALLARIGAAAAPAASGQDREAAGIEVIRNASLTFMSYDRDVHSMHKGNDPEMTNEKLNAQHNATTVAMVLDVGGKEFTVDLFSLPAATRKREDFYRHVADLFNKRNGASVNHQSLMNMLRGFHEQVRAEPSGTRRMSEGMVDRIASHIYNNLYKGRHIGHPKGAGKFSTVPEIVVNSEGIYFSKPVLVTGNKNTPEAIKRINKSVIMLYSYKGEDLPDLSDDQISDLLLQWAEVKTEGKAPGRRNDIGVLVVHPRKEKGGPGADMFRRWKKNTETGRRAIMTEYRNTGDISGREKEALMPSNVRLKMVALMTILRTTDRDAFRPFFEKHGLGDKQGTDSEKIAKSVYGDFTGHNYRKLAAMDPVEIMELVQGYINHTNAGQVDGLLEGLFPDGIAYGLLVGFTKKQGPGTRDNLVAGIDGDDVQMLGEDMLGVTLPEFNMDMNLLNEMWDDDRATRERQQLAEDYRAAVNGLPKLSNAGLEQALAALGEMEVRMGLPPVSDRYGAVYELSTKGNSFSLKVGAMVKYYSDPLKGRDVQVMKTAGTGAYGGAIHNLLKKDPLIDTAVYDKMLKDNNIEDGTFIISVIEQGGKKYLRYQFGETPPDGTTSGKTLIFDLVQDPAARERLRPVVMGGNGKSTDLQSLLSGAERLKLPKDNMVQGRLATEGEYRDMIKKYLTDVYNAGPEDIVEKPPLLARRLQPAMARVTGHTYLGDDIVKQIKSLEEAATKHCKP